MAKLTETRPIYFYKMTRYYTLVPGASTEIVAECRAPKVSGGLYRPHPTVARSLLLGYLHTVLVIVTMLGNAKTELNT